MHSVQFHEILFTFTFTWPLSILFSLLMRMPKARKRRIGTFAIVLFGPIATLAILWKFFGRFWKIDSSAPPPCEERNERSRFLRRLGLVFLGGLSLTALSGVVVFLHPGWTAFYFASIKIHSWIGYAAWLTFYLYLFFHIRHYRSAKAAIYTIVLTGLITAMIITLNYMAMAILVINIPLFIASIMVGKRMVRSFGAEGGARAYKAAVALTFIGVMTFSTGAYIAEPFNTWVNNNMGLYVLYIHGTVPLFLLPWILGLVVHHVWPRMELPTRNRLKTALLFGIPVYLILFIVFSVYQHWKWFGLDAGPHFWPPKIVTALYEEAISRRVTYVTHTGPPPAPLEGTFPAGYEQTLDDYTVCSTKECHPDIVNDWRPSGHRFAASNKFFLKVMERMQEDLGSAELNYFCLNCHAPSLVLHPDRIHGITVEKLKTSVGVSCKACHTMSFGTKTQRPWDGHYELRPEIPYPVSLSDPDYMEKWADFIRWDLRLHFKNYSIPDLSVSSELCASCHVSSMPSFVTGLADDMKVTDLFTSWKESTYAEQGETCVSCHMPQRTRDVRNFGYPDHRIPGINTGISLMVEGDEETMELVRKYENFTRELNTGRNPWPDSIPFLELEIETPEHIPCGQAFSVKVKTTNTRVGHYFHAGPSSLNEYWLELKITDAAGRVVFHSGSLDERNRAVDPAAHRLGARVLDDQGNQITDCSIWRVSGVEGARRIKPKETIEDDYAVSVPEKTPGPLEILARWNHRRASQDFVDWVYGGQGPAFPVVVLVTQSKTVQLRR